MIEFSDILARIVNMDVYEAIAIAEIVIGLFGIHLSYIFRRNLAFRIKLGFVYSLPLIAGVLSLMFPMSDVHILTQTHLVAFMVMLSILYWREVKNFTTSEGFHKRSLSNYLDNVPDLIWVKDVDNKFSYANKAMLRIYNVDKEEMIGKTPLEIQNKFLQKLQRFDFGQLCFKSDQFIKQTNRARVFLESGYINDRYYAFQVYKSPIYSNNDGEQKLIGYVGIARDLTYDVLDHNEIDRLLKSGDLDKAYALFAIHKSRYDIFNKESELIKHQDQLEQTNENMQASVCPHPDCPKKK